MRNRVLWTVLLGSILAAGGNAGPFFTKDSSVKGLLECQRATKPCGLQEAGYWILPVTTPQGVNTLQVEPYFPMPGDILLYDNFDKLISVVMKLAGTSGPTHTAIVISRPDGTPAILEVGPNSRPQAFTKVFIVEVFPRLSNYCGTIYVRRPRHPLTCEQSKHLTDFALAQQGKDFAVGRLALQITPFRCRTGLRHLLFAQTTYDRDRWVCSENVVAAGTLAGLFDPKVHFANCMYPRDLAYDEQYDLSSTLSPPVLWVPDPNIHIEGNRVQYFKKEN